MIENHFNFSLKVLRSDNGPEFLMTDFFNRKGIVHQTSYVETQQQNNIFERKYQHLLNVACARIFSVTYLFVFGHMLSNTLFI